MDMLASAVDNYATSGYSLAYLCAAGVRVDAVVIDSSSVHDHAVDSAR